ncbi:hypothetical protein E2C01_051776 [Portunus trituberculatus]|uniref:Uncharacterized protein n=1 Tax=Portunus trituberculatus TaxID=210409 RepID=A0A5B7GLD7_PORTR|nr:hypothetical protein [Portunus trituberculatus]
MRKGAGCFVERLWLPGIVALQMVIFGCLALPPTPPRPAPPRPAPPCPASLQPPPPHPRPITPASLMHVEKRSR